MNNSNSYRVAWINRYLRGSTWHHKHAKRGFAGCMYSVKVRFSPTDFQLFKPGFINSQAGRGNSCYYSNSAHDFREVPVGVTKHLVQSTVQIILTDMTSIYVISPDDETHNVHMSGFMNHALSFGDCSINKIFCVISIKFARIWKQWTP